MADLHACPVCDHERTRTGVTNRDVIAMTCPECGNFRMSAVFAGLATSGWKSVPEEQRQTMAHFLRSTRELRAALHVELPVLSFDMWRQYVQDGQNCIRREQLH